ncbi:Hypothetical Protein FCC1311_003342 [Hondaea fermentalgiana]|uniref:Uncharacterized protein n=1 Tax=Hondaea fermentalgiana TaxID=2315210 RepID=A0A2R5FZD4_9STRA|nr:Hypothetical Protein FCC1311_003342 [Hondaea fermentalgiana]|eukprot:GBG24116.1 Hypothetical Protein FCC1311_003342 [Hondaea fermentalgiana]
MPENNCEILSVKSRAALNHAMVDEGIAKVILSEQLDAMDFEPWGKERPLKKFEMKKNEQHIAVIKYVTSHRGSSALQLRHSQQLVVGALQSGRVEHQVERIQNALGNDQEEFRLEERDLGPLALTQPGLQCRIATGEGKTLLCTIIALLTVLGQMPVQCDWLQCKKQAWTLASFLHGVLTRAFSSDVPAEQSILDQVACDNANVSGYVVRDKKSGKKSIRLFESAVVFGYHRQPAETFLEELPDLTKLLEDPDSLDRVWSIIQGIIEERTGIRPEDTDFERVTLIKETMLSGAVAYKQGDEVHIVKLGAELFTSVFGKTFRIGEYAPALFETVIIGDHLYTPFSWLLSRTVSFHGGKDQWRTLMPLLGYENSSCTGPSQAYNAVLLVGNWTTLAGTRRGQEQSESETPTWLSRAHWGKLIRDEADIASKVERQMARTLTTTVEPCFPVSFHFSGTCDVLSTKQRVARNILGARHKFGYGLGQSVSIQDPPSSLPSIILYDADGKRRLGGKYKSDVGDFFSGMSVFSYTVQARAGKISEEAAVSSAKERRHYKAMMEYLPFAGTASFSSKAAVDTFKQDFKKIARKKSPPGPNASARVVECYHCCNPAGDGLYSGYIVTGPGNAERWVSLPEAERPKLKQFLIPIIDLMNIHECWNPDTGDFEPIDPRNVETILREGAANLLVVLMKKIRGFNFPLQQFVMVLRTQGVKMNQFIQVLGRVTRNHHDTNMIRKILETHKGRLEGSVDDALDHLVRNYLCGTGIPKRHLAKFLIIRDDEEHKLLAAKALFKNGIVEEDIATLLQSGFSKCMQCGKPQNFESTPSSNLYECGPNDPCADITLKTYEDCFDKSSTRRSFEEFSDVGMSHDSSDSESASSPSPKRKAPRPLPAIASTNARRRLSHHSPAGPPPVRERVLDGEEDQDDNPVVAMESDTPDAPTRPQKMEVDVVEVVDTQANNSTQANIRLWAEGVHTGRSGRSESNELRVSSERASGDDASQLEASENDAESFGAQSSGQASRPDPHPASNHYNDDAFGDSGISNSNRNSRSSSSSSSSRGAGSGATPGRNVDVLRSNPRVQNGGHDTSAPTRDASSTHGAHGSADNVTHAAPPSLSRRGRRQHVNENGAGDSDDSSDESNSDSDYEGDGVPANSNWPKCSVCSKEAFFTSASFTDQVPDLLMDTLRRSPRACMQGMYLVNTDGKRCGFKVEKKHVSSSGNVEIDFSIAQGTRRSKNFKLFCFVCAKKPLRDDEFLQLVGNPSEDPRVFNRLLRDDQCARCEQQLILWLFNENLKPIGSKRLTAGYAPQQRKLLDALKQVRVDGEQDTVRHKVYTTSGVSAETVGSNLLVLDLETDNVEQQNRAHDILQVACQALDLPLNQS